MAVPNRIVHLDYLRGLAALSVMLFHFQKWDTDHWDANTFLGKCGVYAVSVFFVLSGLTLTLVYQNRLTDRLALLSFTLKRLFRIFPLFWFATVCTFLLNGAPYPVSRIILNMSGLFGFIDPVSELALGAWSVGDELVYYCVFPLLLWCGLHKKWLFQLLSGITFLTGGLYAFVWTKSGQAFTALWPVYLEPMNHGFFFITGMVFGLRHEQIARVSPVILKRMLALCLLLFAFYTPGPDAAGLITGYNRVILSLLTLGLVGAWYGAKPGFTGIFDRALRWSGEVSYAVYLLHPLVYRSLKALDIRYLEGSSREWLFVGSLIVTLLLSHFSYRWFEKPVMGFGNRLLMRIAARNYD